MKKQLMTFRVVDAAHFDGGTSFFRLTPETGELPRMLPGQFVNILVENCDGVFLRRPISICDVWEERSLLSLMIKDVGKGTHALCQANRGDKWNILLPLGNSFPIDYSCKAPLLIGGGIGRAPMLYLGRTFKEKGIQPVFIIGGASAVDLPLLQLFREIGMTYVTTVDGTYGKQGVVTDCPYVKEGHYDAVYCCGPTPMMKAVANLAREGGIKCYVSLENRMACGLGACLCCVEDTTQGNKCVCTEGPVFDTKDLKW